MEHVELIDDGKPIIYPDRIYICWFTRSVVPNEHCQFSLNGESLKHPEYVLASGISGYKEKADKFAMQLEKLNWLDIDELSLIEAKEMRQVIQEAAKYLRERK